jgi:NTP pyrophosphatase (non-canonical NTP hydrolase)
MTKLTNGPNPWMPMTGIKDLRVLGKTAEELGECSAVVARCIIQGIDEREPTTGKRNRKWLEEEIADVIANFELTIEEYDLDTNFIEKRVAIKTEYLRRWK